MTTPDREDSPQKPAKNLIQKCAAVMASITHVPKRGHNSFHNYDYATEADIADAVRESMAREGVMLIPSVDKCEFREAQTKSGTERAATLTVRYRLTDGAESIEFNVIGEGQDRGDKATYKAMTGATKYALLKLFLISTGDDPEAEDGEKPPPARGSQTPPPAKPTPNAPLYAEAAWTLAKRIYGSPEKAKDPWKAACTTILGAGRDPKTMNEKESLDIEAILKEGAAAPAEVPF